MALPGFDCDRSNLPSALTIAFPKGILKALKKTVQLF
jgi:hypothetical protein